MWHYALPHENNTESRRYSRHVADAADHSSQPGTGKAGTNGESASRREGASGSNGTVNRHKELRAVGVRGVCRVAQRAQLVAPDLFGHRERVAAQQVDVFAAEG